MVIKVSKKLKVRGNVSPVEMHRISLSLALGWLNSIGIVVNSISTLFGSITWKWTFEMIVTKKEFLLHFTKFCSISSSIISSHFAWPSSPWTTTPCSACRRRDFVATRSRQAARTEYVALFWPGTLMCLLPTYLKPRCWLPSTLQGKRYPCGSARRKRAGSK